MKLNTPQRSVDHWVQFVFQKKNHFNGFGSRCNDFNFLKEKHFNSLFNRCQAGNKLLPNLTTFKTDDVNLRS